MNPQIQITPSSSDDNTTPVSFPFYARLASILLAVVLILLLMYVGKSIFIHLFFAVLIAFMLLPVTKFLERHRVPRGIGAILSILLFASLVGGLFYFLGDQIADFTKDLPKLGSRLQGWIKELQDHIAGRYHVDTSKQVEYLNKAASGVLNSATVVAQALLVGVLGMVIWTILVFIFTFFILTHRSLIKKFIICIFRTRDQPRVMDVLSETRLLANGYVIGLLIEMVIVAALNCTAFMIFGVKYGLLLGILAAVLNLIPYIGIYTSAAIAAIITLSNSEPKHALTVIIILLCVHFLDSNILMPRIVGSRVKMNPLVTIVAVLSGELIWGIPGMFLFIPLVAILKIIFERVDGLKPWAMVMGTETDLKKEKKEEVKENIKPK